MSQDLRRKLKAARAKLGLSQSQAAEKWGVPLRTLINWENDQRTPKGLALDVMNQRLDAILEKSPAKKAVRKKR